MTFEKDTNFGREVHLYYEVPLQNNEKFTDGHAVYESLETNLNSFLSLGIIESKKIKMAGKGANGVYVAIDLKKGSQSGSSIIIDEILQKTYLAERLDDDDPNVLRYLTEQVATPTHKITSDKHVYCYFRGEPEVYFSHVNAKFLGWNDAINALIKGTEPFEKEVNRIINQYGKHDAHKIFWFVADLLGNPYEASNSKTIPFLDEQRSFLKQLSNDPVTRKRVSKDIIYAQYECA